MQYKRAITCSDAGCSSALLQPPLLLVLLLLLLLPLAPLPRVLEQLEPGPGAARIQAQLRGVPGALPHEEAALGVGHHGQVAAVGGAQRGDAIGRAIGVGGVLHRSGALGIAVPACQACV